MQTDFRFIQVQARGQVAVLTLNHPPVNQLSRPLVEELGKALSQAYADETIKAIVVTGTGRHFIAGADITWLQKIKTAEELLAPALESTRFVSRMETGSKPVVAAINGNCLGGGLEIAMACHYRLATTGVNLGQPEVTIGLIPGAGGTQRLPRLIGLGHAIEMIATGKPIQAETALQRGLLDEVTAADELIDRAVQAAQRFIKGELDLRTCMTRSRNQLIPGADEKKAILNLAKTMAAAKAKGHIAPLKAIEAIDLGLSHDIDRDLAREAELFVTCAVSPEAKNLIGIFLNTRSAGRLPRIASIAPARIEKVAILGGGVMGSGIANLLLSGGYETILWEIDDAALGKALAAVQKTYDFPIRKGKMKPRELEAMLAARLKTTTDLKDLSAVDLVIEAVVENMTVKQQIWGKLQDICPPFTLFATNTSALPITEMASILSDPGRMIGLHFFNPAHRMQLLEIICAQKTSDATLATCVAFARSIKKVPIVVNDGPGFYVSRQLGGLMGPAVYLTADGVDPALIEQAMLNFGMPMGPAGLADLTGIDINYHVGKTFETKLGPRYKVHPLTKRIYQTGCYGRKTGTGYMDYSGEKPVPNPKVGAVIQAYLAENDVKPKQVSEQQIIDSMLANAINEAAYMIQEGICDRPRDMDLAMVYGTGFPPYRGGVLRHADQWGLRNVHAKLKELEARYGEHFKAAALIEEMAESGRTFYPV
jgi:3-hydroxyacyl-CoA dehydrogenase/enoyl-CoA hydratase/carnithine racemase